jgi:hypothetical protein
MNRVFPGTKEAQSHGKPQKQGNQERPGDFKSNPRKGSERSRGWNKQIGVSLSHSLHDELKAEPISIRPDHLSLDEYVLSGFVGYLQGDDLPGANLLAGLDENP